MKSVLLLLVLLFIPILLFSQMKNQKQAVHIEGKLSLAGGMYYPDITLLNQYLSDASLPVQSIPFYTMGIVYQVISEDVISDLEFHWSFNKGLSDGTYQVSYRSNIQLFNLGYLLINFPFLHIYPLVGIGRGSTKLESTQVSTPSFTQVLTNGVGTFTMDNSGVILHAALSLDIMIPMRASTKNNKLLNIGIRGGYIFDYSDNKWNAGGVEVSDGPAKVLSGAYVRVLLGVAL